MTPTRPKAAPVSPLFIGTGGFGFGARAFSICLSLGGVGLLGGELRLCGIERRLLGLLLCLLLGKVGVPLALGRLLAQSIDAGVFGALNDLPRVGDGHLLVAMLVAVDVIGVAKVFPRLGDDVWRVLLGAHRQGDSIRVVRLVDLQR